MRRFATIALGILIPLLTSFTLAQQTPTTSVPTLIRYSGILIPAQTLTTLASFDGSNGADPQSSLIEGGDGNLYGTTYSGGFNQFCDDRFVNGCGTVFKVNSSGTLTTLHRFCLHPFSGCSDGEYPNAGLVQATDGNFYGTTISGGDNYGGTVFRISAGGTLTVLYSFCSHCLPGGDAPYGGLVQGTDGDLYGTTVEGAGGGGAVFKITTGGTLTVLHTFEGPDGLSAYSGLVQGTDGNFYGTTTYGGASHNCSLGCGTVFKITPSGTLTSLYSFCLQTGCPDGYFTSGLILATDGNFYGTTTAGGANGSSSGTVFKITPGGTLTTLYSFCAQTGCPDGREASSGLIQASDGNLYGTTAYGGGSQNCGGGCGTVFRITLEGTLSVVHSFAGMDGSFPYAALLQAADGNFYGTTTAGGTMGMGTVFRLSGPSPSPLQFTPITPCRLADTRPQHGGGGPIEGGTFQIFNLRQLAMSKGCGDLSSAAAYSLNVAVVPSGPLGYLTLWPTNGSRPGVSTLNSLDGRIKANAAIGGAGSAGAVSVYVTNTTNVVIDIDGYFAPVTGSTLAFYPLTPCRVVDTRKDSFLPDLGPPALMANMPRSFPVLESTTCIPRGINPQAYSFNFTVVPVQQHPVGYLSVWPTGQSQPVVSTLNDQTGTIVANAALVPAGTNGAVTVFSTDDTQLLIDVNGYFAPAGLGGMSLYPVAPCRVIDTRKIGTGQPFSGRLNPPVDVEGSACAPPGTAQAYVFNATVVPSGSLGYLTLWQNDPGNQPVVSTLNALDGAITNNVAIVPTADGKVDAYASGITQLILDISGYFAP